MSFVIDKDRKCYKEVFAKDTREPLYDYIKWDERRLRDVFNDIHLRIRYNHKIELHQVWYVAPHDMYCICNIEHPYNIARVIKTLDERQESGKKLLFDYIARQERERREQEDRVRSYTREVAKVADNVRKGKVTVRV